MDPGRESVPGATTPLGFRHLLEAWARVGEMHQARKGSHRYFGMKAHFGVDLHSGLTRSLRGTAADEAELNQTDHLLHGQDKHVYG